MTTERIGYIANRFACNPRGWVAVDANGTDLHDVPFVSLAALGKWADANGVAIRPRPDKKRAS